MEDIISSPIVKGTIINNSDCKILLDQRKYVNKFDEIQSLLGLTDKERAQILSINMANNPSRKYKEVWVGLGGSQSAVYATEVSSSPCGSVTTSRRQRAEAVALSNAVDLFLENIRRDNSIRPSFNTFYEFIRDEYQDILREKRTREKDFDVWGFLNVLEPYYRGGEYDFLLNSDKQLDLLNKRFIVFELDNIKDNKVLFPIVTIIIMETFINKMRKLKGIRKMILLEEAWKAISKEGMAEYLRYLFKTVRKFFGEAVVVTQEVEDIISSSIVKGTIINNADCKILLDQRKYVNKFDEIQALLGLTDKERAQILSINMANNPSRKYKEVWVGLGGSQSAVYATEVSLEEYYCYTTEETEKLELMRLTEKLGGNIELAIKQLAESKREK